LMMSPNLEKTLMFGAPASDFVVAIGNAEFVPKNVKPLCL
jgi:hypothetical protein